MEKSNFIKSQFSVLLFTLLLFSCSNRDSDTKIFSQYLHEKFNLEIEKNAQSYIIVSPNACAGCLDFIRDKISENNNYIFILPKKFKDLATSNVLIDSALKFNQLKFHGGNIGKISTENGEIKKFKKYDPYEMKNLFQEF